MLTLALQKGSKRTKVPIGRRLSGACEIRRFRVGRGAGFRAAAYRLDDGRLGVLDRDIECIDDSVGDRITFFALDLGHLLGGREGMIDLSIYDDTGGAA